MQNRFGGAHLWALLRERLRDLLCHILVFLCSSVGNAPSSLVSPLGWEGESAEIELLKAVLHQKVPLNYTDLIKSKR